MGTLRFRSEQGKDKNTMAVEEDSLRQTLSNPKKMGNPPVEDLTRWEEDGGTVLYDCFVADQSFHPYDDEFLSEDTNINH